MNSMVAGAKYRGEFEERAKQLIDEVTAKKGELILFIDELHTIVGAGQGRRRWTRHCQRTETCTGTW